MRKIYIPIIFVLSLLSLETFAQNRTVIKGVVIDSLTKEKLLAATIVIKNTHIATLSDIYGDFNITTQSNLPSDSLVITCMGYENKVVKFDRYKHNNIRVTMQPADYKIDSVVVRSTKRRYRRKDNPALELVQKLIERNSQGDLSKMYSQYDYERYEKITVSLREVETEKLSKSLAFLEKYKESNDITGGRAVPISVREAIFSANVVDKSKREKVVAKRSEGIDEKFAQDNIDTYLNTIAGEIDVFQPNVHFLMRSFVSPLSNLATVHYKYYLSPDTVEYKGARCVNLSFSPYDRNSLGFTGNMLVTADSTLFIRKIELSFPSSMNINFIYNMVITQEFEEGVNGERILTNDDLYYNFMVFSENDKIGFDVRRINSYRDYRFEQGEVYVSTVEKTDETFWASRRHIPITDNEKQIENIVAGFRKVPMFIVSEALILLFSEEYFHVGKYFDAGSIMNFISANPLEGPRVLFGGVTTTNLSPRLFLEGYLAYGVKDQKFKWNSAVEYSFINKEKNIREFPIHSIRAEYNYDVFKFGRQYGEASRDKMLSWVNRRTDSALTYLRSMQLIYTRESRNGLSLYATARNATQYESAVMNFAAAGALPEYTMTELQLRFRYAPNEKIMENSRRRRIVKEFKPIFELSHTTGFKNLMGGDYSHNHTELKFMKRIDLSPVGFLDADLSVGAEWNEVPYMLLPHAHANLTYLFRQGIFSLMNPLEFMQDRYAKWDLEWHLNGFILNKIPLVRRLKWREVLSTKGMFGKLTDKNNPAINTNLLQFPTYSSPMGHRPYIEAGIGVENIFKFFRVDYIRRLSYKGKSGSNDWGILLSVSAKF